MYRRSNYIYNALILITLLFAVSAAAQDDSKEAKKPTGKPVIWEPTNIADQDLALGPGGAEMKPDLSNITFVEEEKGGYSKKYKIKDGAGNKWVAKIGLEAQPETAAVRIMSAIGYKTDINYLVPELTIPGRGTFDNVRMEARPKDVERFGTWSWKENPFLGTREFQGLKIMMSFLNNWDMKEDNNVLLQSGDKLYYAISDLGATFGKTGSNGLPIFWRIGRSRNDPEQYAESDFVKRVKDGKITLSFNGKNDGSMGDIRKDDARWLADLLLQLSDKQIADAFRAARYSPSDVDLLTQSVKSRIRALDLATQ